MAGKRTSSHLLVRMGYYALMTVAVLGVLYCLYLMLVPIIASTLLMFLLEPLINYFEARGLRRMVIVLLLYLLAIGTGAGAVYFLAPRLADQAQNFSRDMPKYRIMLEKGVGDLQVALKEKFPQLDLPDLNQVVRDHMPKGGGAMNIDALIAYSSSFFAILSVVCLIPIVLFFFLVDGHLIQKAVLRMVPNRYFEMTYLLIHHVMTALKLFLRGQLIDAGAVALMTAVGLSAIGLPYAIVIGLVAGIGNLIPYLGGIIGFIPAFLVIMVTGKFTMVMLIKIISVSAIVQFIESTFVYPIAVGKSSDLHPLVVIIAVTVGGTVGGIVGMLIAIPLISVAKVSIETLSENLKSYGII